MIRHRTTGPCTAVRLALAAVFVVCAQTRADAPIEPFESPGEVQPAGRIDELVFARLQALEIAPAHLCSDAVFVRRAYLDITGTLPTAAQAEAFIRDRTGLKRRALIDDLLDRDEFAEYWAMKHADVLRLKAEFPIKLWPKAAQAYHRYLRDALRENRPYDRLARELLLATGSNFYAPPVNFFRAVQNREPRGLAAAVALTFMGERAERWPARRLDDLAVFFSQVSYKSTAEWKEEIVYLDPAKTAALPHIARLPDGQTVALPRGRDAREALVDWLIAPENPCFARAAVNRTWYWLMGRGVVHEADDLRPDNPPSNPELLAHLEKEFVDSGYDFKHLCRIILNSTTYELSSIPATHDPAAVQNFACYPLRRLEAEVLIDALCQLTGEPEEYSSVVPEPFTFIPPDVRAVAIDDGNTTSAFLELFGRASRDTGLLSERNNASNASQRLHLLNSSHVQNKIAAGPALRPLLAADWGPSETVDAVYLTILSRYPTADERRIALDHAAAGGLAWREAAVDLLWALINSEEFLHRH